MWSVLDRGLVAENIMPLATAHELGSAARIQALT